MDDFVGRDGFQWPPQMLLAATAVRQSLPDRLLVNPHKPTTMLPRIVKKPDPEKMRQSDPSEVADSSRILDCVRRRFPGADIIMTGGVIYHLALSDLLANFAEDEDFRLLERLLELDDMCNRCWRNALCDSSCVEKLTYVADLTRPPLERAYFQVAMDDVSLAANE